MKYIKLQTQKILNLKLMSNKTNKTAWRCIVIKLFLINDEQPKFQEQVLEHSQSTAQMFCVSEHRGGGTYRLKFQERLLTTVEAWIEFLVPSFNLA